MAGNSVRIVGTFSDGITRKLNDVSRGFDKIGGKGSSASLFGNVGAMAIAKGFSLVGVAAEGLVGLLGDSIKAAMEDEESIAHLTQSLRANVPAWDGVTDAIERKITAQMELGFSDEEQRASLALLVAATHDVAKAQDIQTTAMDLARFKHISLQDATEALTKVEGGSYRILKSLGIVLKDGATAQDALTAVQKVATGQAEAYANTTAGKLTKAQIKINEAMEHAGSVIMPLVAQALDGIGVFMDWLAPKVEAVGRGWAKFTAFIGDVIGAIKHLIGWIKDAVAWLDTLSGRQNKVTTFTYGMTSHTFSPTGHAEGGWVGLHGPELAMVGEKGPEYVIPNHALGDGGGKSGGGSVPVQIPIMIDGREIARVVDERLYYAVSRAAPTLSRS